ncbi:MAG: hypothetical protein HQL67_00385 [Magnetococcales bacterium]|nr:hypothetical protein [Magnetococcales bacterium]
MKNKKSKRTAEESVDSGLYKTVKRLLVSSRTLNAKTATAIINGLNVDDAIAGLSAGRVNDLEEFEIELLLSPLFTPSDLDRAACESVLSPLGLKAKEYAALQAKLCRANLTCPVVYGVDTGSLVIPDIVIERYLKLLDLTSPVSESIIPLLETAVAEDNRNWAFSLARRPVWRNQQNRDVLLACLEKMIQNGSFSAEKLDFLTSFVRTYRPKETENLLIRLTNMIEAYHRDKDHPVYNRNLAKKQEKSLMPLSCNTDVRAARISMAAALLSDFELNAPSF